VASVLSAGIAVLDEIFRVARFPAPGTKVEASDFLAVVGGCAANAAIAVTRLGGTARLVSPIGDDEIGARILAELAGHGVDCSGVMRMRGTASALSTVLVDQSGERLIVTYRGRWPAQIGPIDPERVLSGIDAVVADNRVPELVVPICAAARRRGLPVVLDVDKAAGGLDTLLAHASHAVFSADGLRAVSGLRELEAGLVSVAAKTPAFVAVTDGPRDILWMDGPSLRRLPVFRVAEVVDTLAAGDVFHGAFALALAEGADEAPALRFAAATAAIKCTRFGGGSVVPTREEVKALLAAEEPRGQ
jgi:sugar/nucleoside kinase (ribokinase family)